MIVVAPAPVAITVTAAIPIVTTPLDAVLVPGMLLPLRIVVEMIAIANTAGMTVRFVETNVIVNIVEMTVPSVVPLLHVATKQ